MKGDGIKVAYCNADYLIMLANGSTGNSPNLDAVPNPPKGTVDGIECVTGDKSLTKEAHIVKIPLNPVMLSTSTRMNNVNTVAYPDGGTDSA